MKEMKKKILVPSYSMTLSEFYLLLRIQMEQTGRKNINGVKKEFFEPETYKGSSKMLKSLTKHKLLEQQNDNVMLSEGLQKALGIILNSAYCMNFQNDTLRKKEQLLSFYYADGRYVGVLQDKNKTTVVCTDDVAAVYMAFEKVLEDKCVSETFQAEKWERLYGEKMNKPVREAMIVHSANRKKRQRMTVAMTADGHSLYIIRCEDDTKYDEIDRDVTISGNWFGVVVNELERLKQNSGRSKGEAQESKKDSCPDTEYQRVVKTEGFPMSGFGFWFWCLKRIIVGIPELIRQAARKKFLPAIMYLIWAIVLFFYNMYITCCFNDTFRLDKRAAWGNLTPYLMAGELRTPSSIKGFNIHWGTIDTVFLVWPLMMLLTLIGRHLILRIKKRKAGFLKDLFMIRESVRDCRRYGYGKGREVWVPLLITWVTGFIIMNPITLFLAAVYFFLIFAQGNENGLVQFCMLWRCAENRRKVEEGISPEPRSEKYRILFWNIGCGFLIYALVSLLLWHVVGYHFWIRLIVTMLMAIFALLQIFWPGKMADAWKKRTVKFILLFVLAAAAANYFSSKYGIVLADDGGWSESGRTLSGLIQNAGFSTILGLTVMTIALALGGPVGWVVAGSCILGAGTFALGLTDTKVGNYISKTSRQYFFGPDDGESKTLLCTATQLAGFVAGFLNPAAGASGAATKLFYGGKVATDVVSMIGDGASTVADIEDYINGSNEVNAGDLVWDILGLSLDICGFHDDVKDAGDIFKEVNRQGDAYRYAKETGFVDRYREMDNSRNAEISDMQANNNTMRQAALDAETARHENQIARIQDSMDKIRNGEISPPSNIDSDTFLHTLTNSLDAENGIYAENMSNITSGFEQEAKRLEQVIREAYNNKETDLMEELLNKMVNELTGIPSDQSKIYESLGDMISKGYDLQDIYDNIEEFFTTND